MSDKKEVLILFSGGKDSFLSTLLMIEKGYKVNLVTYENSCGLKAMNVKHSIDRLKEKYGKEVINFLGIKNITVFWRELLYPYYNKKLSEILSTYGDIPISQFNCLTCRLAMYIASIILCKQNDIKIVVDGARTSQLFAIEQKEMLDVFMDFFKQYNIDIIFPVKDIKDDYELKNDILIRGFVPKMLEPQCLLGMPISEKDNTQEVVNASKKAFENLLKDKSKYLIEKYKNLDLGGTFY